MYNLDLNKFCQSLLPPALRQGKTLAWVYALLAPLRTMAASLLAYVTATRQELAYNAQRLLFEKALNDKHDPADRRIYIGDTGANIQPFYLNFTAEAQPPKYVYTLADAHAPLYLFMALEFINPTGFYVFVPEALVALELGIKRTVDRLRLACTLYEIRYF